jgi:hypothetical protein
MANSNVTIDMVTREALRVAHESCQFIATTDRQYDDSFAKTGAKIGSSLRVRKPNQYVRTSGSRVMDIQDQDEQTSTITVATQDHVDMRFNSAELALSIDELSKRYIEPAVKVLVSNIEADYLAYATKKVYNVVGTAGTAITNLSTPGLARARLNQMLAPKDNNRAIQMDSITMAGLVNGVAAYFNPSNAIASQYKEGLVARTSMADYYENERVWNLTNSSDVTVTTAAAAAVTDGGTNITLASVASATTAGMVFTVAGVYACHPETKQSLGYLQPYVVVTGGTTTQEVSPATILTGPRQNVCSAASAQLATTAYNGTSVAVTFFGTQSLTYAQPLMYHKEAFQFVTADLPIMDDASKCVRRTQDGLSLRVWQASDIRNDEMLMRIDILYGMSALRPEWGCRMIGAAAA